MSKNYLSFGYQDIFENKYNEDGELVRVTKNGSKKFKGDLLATREELRGVQFDLRKDVDWIKNMLIAVNVAGVPIAVGVIALLLAFRSRRRALPRKDA